MPQAVHERVERHPERDRYLLLLLLVLLVSDGHNGYGKPIPVAKKIKAMNIYCWPVTIAAASVVTHESPLMKRCSSRSPLR